MRPSKLRSERQNQYNYLTGEELQRELQKQVEEKKRHQMAEQIQNQQDILQHYRNYQLGADQLAGEDPVYMNDLNALMQNKERFLEQMQGKFGVGMQQNMAFQGDMNAAAQREARPEPQNIFNRDKGLFDDNFVGQYKPGPSNNENLNIINNIFGNQSQPSVQLNIDSNERERRLKLRDQERRNRQEGIYGGGYGQHTDSAPPSQPAQPQSSTNIFGEQAAAGNKRDQIWQQKMKMKRGESADLANRIPPQPPVQQQLPIFQNQGQPPQFQQQLQQIPQFQNQLGGQQMMMDDVNNLRNSRVFQHLDEAKKLDQSINEGEKVGIGVGGILPGEKNDLEQRRRENQKKQMQQEYQQFLKRQGGGVEQPQSQIVPIRPESHEKVLSPGTQQKDQNVLAMGGLHQIGIHQMRQEEDKQRKQREYREYLDSQKQQRVVSASDRRQQLSDQVFAEVMGQHLPSQHPSSHQAQAPQVPPQLPRGTSAREQNRKEALQQQEGSAFPFAASKDEQRKVELDKKREYRMQLEQQMALKQQQVPPPRRRGTSQAQPQQVSYENMQGIAGGYQQQQMVQFGPQYGVQHIDPAFMQQMPPPQQPQFQGFQQMPIEPLGFQQQQIGFMPPQAMPQQQFAMPEQRMDFPQPGFAPSNQASKQDAISQQRQRQEEYRRELELQVRQKEEQKRQRELEQQKYEQKIEQQIAQPQMPVPQMPQHNQIQQDGQFQQNFNRQLTDVRKQGSSEEEQQRLIKQQIQREELKKQMEEKQRLKEMEKQRQKQEEEMEERKLQAEREQLEMQAHNELVKEGKREGGMVQERKKNVRRDLFEPSQENNTVGVRKREGPAPRGVEAQSEPAMGQKAWDEPPKRREDLFGGGGGGPALDLPINQRNVNYSERKVWESLQPMAQQDIFPNQDLQPSGFRGIMPPQQHPPPSQQMPIRGQPFDYQPPMSAVSAQYSQDSQMQQKMMEEQSKMLIMYQQALQQILEFKTQYFEQVMQMRETIVREREQLMEYEKVKSQQNQEIQSLQAVYNQLGSILHSTQTAPKQQQQQQLNALLNPSVQNNLNSLILNQKEQILRMSANGPLSTQQYQQPPSQQQFQPSSSRQQYQPSPQQVQPQRQTDILEQSLSSDTKLVIIPQNKLATNAGQEMFGTWKNEQMQQQYHQNLNPQLLNSGMQHSLQGSSHFISHQQQQQVSPQRSSAPPQQRFFASRPQTSQPPETIEELPREEDEQMLSLKAQQRAEEDLNNRDEEEQHNSEEQKESALAGTNKTQVNPLVNTNTIQENLQLIEKIISQNQPEGHSAEKYFSQQQQQQTIGMQTGFSNKVNANQSQSSFHNFNNTLYQQKLQEQSQMEELQKQLQRIFGATLKSDNGHLAQLQYEDVDSARPQKTQPNFNPLRMAAENERMQFFNPTDKEEQDALMQSQINVANSMTGTQGAQFISEAARQRFTNNNLQGQFLEESAKEIGEENLQQKILVQQQDANQNVQGSSEEEEEQDVWNDPELIPPPVVMQDDDEEQNFGAFEVNNLGLFQSEIAQDKTIKGLQKFNPPNVNDQSDDQMNLAELHVSSQQQEQDYDDNDEDNEEYKVDESRELSKLKRGRAEEQSERSVTQRERDMMEVQKLIQQANSTTQNLLENSENFKFRIRSENKQSNKKLKNIRINDPFKHAEGRGEQKEFRQQVEGEISHMESKDQFIMDNLDKIINDLQSQKQRQSQAMEPSQQQEEESKFRPISAKQATGKYAQMAIESKGQPKLGKYAQMAIKQDIDIDPKEIEDMSSKYGVAQQNLEQQPMQPILRPVSGKSNSTRYQMGSAQSRRQGQQLQQQPFQDDESDQLEHSKGFNIADVSQEQQDQETFRPQQF